MYNGYVPLRRGIVDHLPKMPDVALKVYIFLLCQAKFKGKDKGKVFMSLKDIASDLEISYPTIKRAIKFLSNHYITFIPAVNQYKVSELVISKYDKSAGISADTTDDTSKSGGVKREPSKESAGIKNDTSGEPPVIPPKVATSGKDKGLQLPKNVKNDKKEVIDSTYLSFETSLLNSWNSMCERNNTLPKAIGISEVRRKKLKERFKEPAYKEKIFEAIDIIPKYPFLLGGNARGWKTSFDWIIHNDNNYLKVMEGFYGKTKSKIDEIIESAKRG